MVESTPQCPYAARFEIQILQRYRGAPIEARCFCGSLWDASDPDTGRRLWEMNHPSQFAYATVETLQALLRMSYAQYLRSLHWQRVWALKMESVHHTCEICGAVARQVHHLVYRRGRERLDQVLALCRPCHMDIHEQDAA